eukprot:CAMPEP_0202867712 /NCGR_PEP_ID=MMETSP1391-20130828/9582_1 /ASSEMBLY_ACC=CAM_ASM_000867 /TAXON_ID=1034604 /ORGANISM="Chlamydomonas leiostraca, Strain SAG 11-49" /LENGTH=627 /DNA_ID=CAMNT_0049547775 /DNA_START=210 /DNA_END=2089 /DNA_ORIENTATION=+
MSDSDYDFDGVDSEDMGQGSDGDDPMSQGSEEAEDADVDDDYGLDQTVASGRKPAFRILKKEDLQERRKQAIEDVVGVLGIAEEDAVRVLRKFKWDVNRLHESWFTDMDAVRREIGLQDEQPAPSKSEETCQVCYDTFPVSEMKAAPCGHMYCQTCWNGYLHEKISSGPACLDVRCPTPKCGAAVPVEVVRACVDPGDYAKFEEFALRSFVEDNRKMAWCVGKHCDAAVECCVDRVAGEPLDVVCSSCGTAFCFNCKQEAHRPVSCDVVMKWVTKNSAESENVTWIMANTKPCPKCHRPIEKNQGCMHMTCSQCKFEFCWLCQGDWKEHGERTGGFYNCNKFETAKRKGEIDEASRKAENAKQLLERYMHYFERWDAHQKARNKAKQDAARVSADWLERLSEQTHLPTSQLKFIMDAWAQIIECRRVLSWTYTYGYYAFDPATMTIAPTNGAGTSGAGGSRAKADEASSSASNAANNTDQNKHFFEFLQGDAERALDKLHEMAESQLKKLMDAAASNASAGVTGTSTGGAGPSVSAGGAAGDKAGTAPSFMEFRTALIGLTDITRGFFDKLVAQLEKGLADLDREYAGRVDSQPLAEEEAVAEVASADGAGPSGAGAVEPAGKGAGR